MRALRAALLTTIAGLAACATTPPPPVDGPDDPPASPGDKLLPRETLGPFALYPLVARDVFPMGPSPDEMMKQMFTGGGETHPPFGWGLMQLQDGTAYHYVFIEGDPDDSANALFAKSGAPSPVLPPHARLIFHGRQFEPTKFIFASVAVDTRAILTGVDVASCAIEDNPFITTDANGNSTTTQRPWLHVTFTAEAQKTLDALPTTTSLVATLGDVALTESWYPNVVPTFPVEGLTDDQRRARATEMQKQCAPHDAK